MSKNNIALVVVLMIVIAGGSFYGGMQYGKNQTASATAGQQQGGAGGGRNRAGGAGGPGGNRFGAGGGAISGSVLSLTSNMLTVKMRDGSSRIVLFSNSTAVNKQVAGALSDVSVGGDVMVIGTTNTDGSVTASNIQIRPPSSTRPF
jgi:hypothetical protein